MKCDDCGKSFETHAVPIYTARVHQMRGWRGHYCMFHLHMWMTQTPMIQKNMTVTITNA